jgi:hypothetical protein
MNIDPNINSDAIFLIKEIWSKPELTVLAIKEETLGNHSLIGTDTTFSS